jgi:hypothetical protein
VSRGGCCSPLSHLSALRVCALACRPTASAAAPSASTAASRSAGAALQAAAAVTQPAGRHTALRHHRRRVIPLCQIRPFGALQSAAPRSLVPWRETIYSRAAIQAECIPRTHGQCTHAISGRTQRRVEIKGARNVCRNPSVEFVWTL